MIWPWEQALGAGNLILRIEDPVSLVQGTVPADFLAKVLGLDPAGFTMTLPRPLDLAALEFRRLVNCLAAPDAVPATLNPKLAQIAPAPASGLVDLVPPALRLATRAAARPANDYVAQRFLGGGQGTLFADLPAPGKPEAGEVNNKSLAELFQKLSALDPGLAAAITSLARAAEASTSTAARVASKRLLGAVQGKTAAAARPPGPKPKRPLSLGGDRADLIVHFGMHKTGSTSIQETLFHNRKALGDSRYLGFGQVNGSFGISRFFRQSDADPADFHLALSKLPPHRGIISAEGLTTLGERQLDAFLKALEANGVNARFIGYVREPVGYYTSMFQQTLKTHSVAFDDPGSWFRRRDSYYKWLDLLVSKVGQDRVRAFPFERRFFPNGNVVAHFLREIGCDPAEFDLESANESLSATAVKALYCYRKVKAPKDADVGAKSPIGTFIQRLPALTGPRFAFAPEVQATISARNADFDDWAKGALIWPEAQPQDKASPRDDGPRTVIALESDLTRFSKEELSQIATWARSLGIEAGTQGSRTAIEHVAETMHRVRMSNLFVQVVLKSEQPLKKLPRWIKTMGRKLLP